MKKGRFFSAIAGLLVATCAMAADFVSDQFTTPAGKVLTITFVRHGSLAMSYDGKQIQVDPVSDYADYNAFPKADLILVTHAHGDHLDLKAIEALRKEGTVVVANPASAEKIERPAAQVMRNGDKKTWEGIQIDAVPAYNTTEGRDKFHPKHRDNGYVLDFDGLRVYVAGDTDNIGEARSVRCDAAFLPVGGTYTMTAAEAAALANALHPQIAVPTHYGSIVGAMTDGDDFAAQLAPGIRCVKLI